ncbi:MAG: hypothetical protein J6U92_03800 [Clostridia bacterium]|nr:hypothetical protein [Clostridia bacterium]
MKEIKNTTANALSAIHGITFTIFFIVDSVFNEFLYPFLESIMHKAIAIALTAIIAAVLYSIVFFIVKFVYDFMLKRKNEKLSIEGTWYHVHIPCCMGLEDYSYNQLSCGTTHVTRNLFDFTFVGDNCKFTVYDGEIVRKDQNATHWYTKATKLSDDNDFDIIQIYEARTAGTQQRELKECPFCKSHFEEPVVIQEAEKFRHGIHKISIITTDSKKTTMKAEYSDCYPSFKNGMLLFYRTEKERDDRVKEFFICAKMQAEQEKNKII